MSAKDDLLQRLLVGSLDPDSDEAREFFVRRPEERARFEALRNVERRLDAAAADRASEVEAAAELRTVPGQDLVSRLVEHHFADRARPEPERDRTRTLPKVRWWLPMLAVAASVLLLWRPWTGTPAGPEPGPDPGPTLGAELRLLHPIGSVGDFDEFRWEGELEGAQYFLLEVFDADDPFGDPLVSVEPDEPLWRPSATELASWPRAVEWTVSVMDTGQRVTSDSAEAWRR